MSDKLDVLFLGRMFPPIHPEAVRNKARVDMQDAANVLQWNLVNGFVNNGCGSVYALSYLPIDSWPRHYKDPFVKTIREETENGVLFHSAKFCNITYVKQILSAKACNSAAKRWARRQGDGKKVIVCYSCNNVLMRAVAAAKKANPDVLAVQVIADITEFAANDTPNLLKRLFIKRQIKKNEQLKEYIDGYVLLTKQMKDKLGLEKPFTVMEGIVPERDQSAVPQGVSEGKKVVLYTGSMNRKYGILELLAAFEKITAPDYELLLCGLGNAEPEIRAAVERDGRISFLGKVPHAKVLALQSEATVVVNPRQNNEEFTKYSFPSKTMEYLASGVPLIAYKLDGIPDEYDEYIHYVPDNSPEALAKTIVNVCEMSVEERLEIGARGKRFVLENKNAMVQTKRILEFIAIL